MPPACDSRLGRAFAGSPASLRRPAGHSPAQPANRMVAITSTVRFRGWSRSEKKTAITFCATV